MVTLEQNELVFSFPELHPSAVCRVRFQRTLRIPDDNRSYPLPPGLGTFPLEPVEPHAERLPAAWATHGGVLLPMYQAEALWLSFSSESSSWEQPRYPFALQIAAGKINAVTGQAWASASPTAPSTPQDYVVLPDQPWLDGFCVQKGLIRQFVAMPLGQGYSAEEQLTGAGEHGGLQLIAYPMKRERYEALCQQAERWASDLDGLVLAAPCSEAPSMGLAPGGLMRQEITEDAYGLDAWDTTRPLRCFVHILNSQQWHGATGQPVPTKPVSAQDYTRAGLPWFEHYGDGTPALDGSAALASLDSVAAKTIKLGLPPLPGNEPVTPQNVLPLGPGAGQPVSDGNW